MSRRTWMYVIASLGLVLGHRVGRPGAGSFTT